MRNSFLILLALSWLVYGAVVLLQRMRRQRRPTPARSPVTPEMQRKMARAMITLITANGMQSYLQARKMGRGYNLTREQFATLQTPPEEDSARDLFARRLA